MKKLILKLINWQKRAHKKRVAIRNRKRLLRIYVYGFNHIF